VLDICFYVVEFPFRVFLITKNRAKYNIKIIRIA